MKPIVSRSTHGAFLQFVLFVALGLFCSSCGYQFQGSGSILPPDVKKVYIPLVENNTTEAGLAVTMTEALRDEFDRYGAVLVVEDEFEADAVLRSRILKVVSGTRSSTSTTDTALQLDTTVTLWTELSRQDGSVLWRNPNLAVTRSFATSSDVVVTSSADFAGSSIGSGDLGALDTREISRGQEQQVLEDLAEEAARKVYDQAVAPDF
ncbi:MAG: LptE family protein [Bdellovibrionales bacterium]|nr:LptE family protein [Bdellovibrionales bacterium]